ncbi:TPA: type IVB secretion system protein IcmB/DotO [Legionella pneumophila]|uniref:type IVB secretion system protein IcmB/DotO n=1 Tax=Legionella pneumophila TaxID=446 RepID=UPI000787E915|nr:type IVB secretion system protein IcmB/DotO [Legionella pneumophila]MDW8879567.1 type IVB secretion system protein IcmB/DotO [Legionella pneumophila subsp. fraseri]MDW8962664.1 type IVB secretion system protein IcmB/DotO [Legionella pneumophila subsp. fraseri]MDW9036659.1 type IVB secretion system protein IcmB/DotO [Legionella pneumophila subsp. fraseri]MDW9039863.1 type IVB secretion system protein IcmB/DotO [Legionella pneumophila subsp. fraseri]MDW9042853.1 type IVB secretion system prot
MANWSESFFEGVDTFFAWLSTSLKQTTESYIDLETADSPTVLVNHDGSLLSILKIEGITGLAGPEEFERLVEGLANSFQAAMGRPGHALQVYFSHDKQNIVKMIKDIYDPAEATANRLELNLRDLFEERVNYLSQYCAEERVYFVLYTRPFNLASDQLKAANKAKMKMIKDTKAPPFKNSQTIFAAVPEIRDTHDAYVRAILNDLDALNVIAKLLEVHDAVHAIRMTGDPDYTADDWRATLPGDKIPVRELNNFEGDPSDLLWPPLSKQVLPRDAEIIDLRTVRVGDKIYASTYIDLFPKDVRPFISLFSRILPSHVPWKISFLLESEGLSTIKLKGLLAAILSFSSAQNRLISDSVNLLKYIQLNTDEAIVRLRVVATTWAPEGNIPLLRRRSSELVKAIEGWGSTDVSEICGDPFAGFVSSMLATTLNSSAVASVAPLSDVISMLPITRPASPWKTGALLFRTPDGKPWPFQPGSTEQTTWIDLVYARPGSGKSVLSNALNLALCLSGGLMRLPRIAIIDIGPSSSGLISLLKEALPASKRHLVAYHRLRMTPDYSINPFDTQLGCRYPTALERSFLVNFMTLLTTPLGAAKPYDGMADLAGMVVDELYKSLADEFNPTPYAPGIEEFIDSILEEIGFVRDAKSTWWEVTDALYSAGFVHEAMLAQRYAMPLLADAASICRTPSIEDLYEKITAPTGESLINAFSRMISSAVREYPILSRVTSFDIGDARVVSLDLDEVAKSGGDAADRQTAVMYMLARYVLARHYYLTEESLNNVPEQYKEYHKQRVLEIREDHKRIVYDEFHRTAKSSAVREQVIIDMREGRKWKVQISLLSQAVDDFDPVMIDFATAIYVMDAGPSQAVEKTSQIFGLSETAKIALRTRVHGPRQGGATFLAQFATKTGINVQLLTLTLGPVELWAFSTTAEDATVRNLLYRHLGPSEARRLLAALFPNGTVTKELEARLASMKQKVGLIEDEEREGMINQLVNDILDAYSKDPNVKSLPAKVG